MFLWGKRLKRMEMTSLTNITMWCGSFESPNGYDFHTKKKSNPLVWFKFKFSLKRQIAKNYFKKFIL